MVILQPEAQALLVEGVPARELAARLDLFVVHLLKADVAVGHLL